MFSQGDKARTTRAATLYRAADEPTVTGELPAGTLVTVKAGPFMGRYHVQAEDGTQGWVANNTLEAV